MTKQPRPGVYRINCGPFFYIGSSADMEKRRQHHLYRLKKGTHHNPKLQQSFNEGFRMKFERLRNAIGTDSLRSSEQEILDLYLGSEFLCNINTKTNGPDADMIERSAIRNRERMADKQGSAETRERMSAAKRGSNNVKSRPVIITAPDGRHEFECVSDAARFLGVKQQVLDGWMRGLFSWPGTGSRPARQQYRHLAEYSAKFK